MVVWYTFGINQLESPGSYIQGFTLLRVIPIVLDNLRLIISDMSVDNVAKGDI